MRTPLIRSATAAALILATTIGLAACSADEDPAPNDAAETAAPEGAALESEEAEASVPASAYDFGNLLVMDPECAPIWNGGPGNDVRVALSDEVEQLVPEGHDIVVDSYDLHARVFATGVCALDVTVNYDPEGPGPQGFTAGTKELHPEAEFAIIDDRTDEERIWDALGLVSGGGPSSDVTPPQFVDDFPSDDDLTLDTKYTTADYTKLTFVKDCMSQDRGIASFDFGDDWQCINDGNSEGGPGRRDAPPLLDNCMNSYWSIASFQALVAGDGSISIPSASVRAAVSVAGKWVLDPEYDEHGN